MHYKTKTVKPEELEEALNDFESYIMSVHTILPLIYTDSRKGLIVTKYQIVFTVSDYKDLQETAEE